MLFSTTTRRCMDWVIGQIDVRDGSTVFGLPHEGQGLSYFHYTNDVFAADHWSRRAPPLSNKLIGTDGTIEVKNNRGDPLRIWAKGDSEPRPLLKAGGVVP
ncbi:MAG: hypothetical protein R2856_12730 [Caldilineaceae bacterium]